MASAFASPRSPKFSHYICILGGGIERWTDPRFRSCYADILSGNWRKHDPYDFSGRLDARLSLYNHPDEVSKSLGRKNVHSRADPPP